MSTIRMHKNYFSGMSKVYDASSSGLAAILRGISINAARNYFKTTAPTAITDNSTGTANGLIVADLPIPPAILWSASASTNAGQSALDTSLTKIRNATKVYATSLNKVRSKLGLPYISYSEGTVASADTIPAQDLTNAPVSAAANSLLYSVAIDSLKHVKTNIHALALGTNEVLTALGQPNLVVAVNISAPNVTPLLAVAATAADNANLVTEHTLTTTALNAFLAATANAFATMAAMFNKYVVLMEPAALTISTGGTAALALAADAAPAAANGAATTSAPKAGFDTQLVVLKNTIASMAAQYNEIATQYGHALLIDNSGGTALGTLAAISASLSAVDGSAGTVALDVVTATARMATAANALSTLGHYVSQLAPYFDADPLGTDALGGTVSATRTLAAIAATGAGVNGALATMLNTAVNTWLAGLQNNVKTVATKLNEITANATTVPFAVIAG